MKLSHFQLIIVAVVLFHSTVVHASFSYTVTVNTDSLAGTVGSLDFQFNPSSGPLTSMAKIANLRGGALIGEPDLFGAVDGLLPSNITITASSPYNDYFQQFKYGSSIIFDLSLDGSPGGSFFFSMFSDAVGTIPALTSDPNGFSLIVDSNKNETTISKPSEQTSITAVPIPSILWLMGMGLLGLIGIHRRDGRKS